MRHARFLALAAVAVAVALGLPAGASAADPIMPLAEVHDGLHCTGLTVVRGTTITSFDVDVVDVVVGTGGSPRILVRASGPAVDATGVAQGFSGSPVLCRGDDGVARNIGAISEATGDYGNKLVLVTPIEAVLGEVADPPGAPPLSVRTVAGRPLLGPLTFSGLTGPVAQAARSAGREAGRTILTAPAVPATTFPPQPLVPGASVAVGLSTGDLAAGAVGTVTYADGGTVWAFGHPLDAAGRRSLLLQDAWVYDVVGSPLVSEEQTPYKLAAPGHALGTLTNDAPDAVVGRLGALPDRIPMSITATDDDSGRVVRQHLELADETAIGLPSGSSATAIVAPVAVAQAAYGILRGSPANQSGSMCLRISLRGRSAPLRFCNDYVGGAPASPGAPMVSDVQQAVGLLDAYQAGTLHVTGIAVDLHLRRERRQAWIVDAAASSIARLGETVRVRLVGRVVRGPRVSRTFRVRVPGGAEPGSRTLVLTGTGADVDPGAGGDLSDVLELSFDPEDPNAGRGPASIDELAAEIAAIHRDTGVTARLAGRDTPVLEEDELRFSGSARVPVTLRR